MFTAGPRVLFTPVLLALILTPPSVSSSPSVSSVEYYKLFTGGISHLLWDSVFSIHNRTDDFLIQHSPGSQIIGNECISSLLRLRSLFESGDLVPFQFVDSSARGQPALLFGTASSLGDYDECLDIDSAVGDLKGQYCLVKYEMRASGKSGTENKIRDTFPVADFYYPLHGLCIPSACSREDLANILSHHIFPQTNSVKLLDISHCDTRESVKLSFDKLNKHQIVSLIFITTFVMLSGIGTLMHILDINILRQHSMIKQVSDLLEPNRGNRIDSADAFKTIFALYGVAIHSIAAVVTPVGAFVLSRIQHVCDAVVHIWLQPLINTHGLHVMSYLGGLAVGSAFYPNAKKGKLRYGVAIIERFIRNVPGILCLLALEFLWPLVGSGPIYTHVAEDLLENCSNNWYLNALFITNYNPVLKNCINHTFWSSIDFQLFLVGLIVIACMKASYKLGIAALILFGAVDHIVTGVMAHLYQTSYSMIHHPLTAPTIIHYVDYIHNQTTNYMFTFLAGLAAAIYMIEKGAANVGKTGLVASIVFMQLAAYSTCLYNNYPHIFPPWTIPLFFVGVKTCWACSNTLSIMYFSYKPVAVVNKSDGDELKQTSEATTKPEPVASAAATSEASLGYRLYLMVSRLSTSMYLVNYWFIRYDFFTARQTFEISTISFFKRFGYSVCFAEIIAFFFYTILLGPLDSYRKRVYTSKAKAD